MNVQVVAELGRAVGADGLVAGQVVDIKSENVEVGLDVLKYIHEHKTAALLEASVVCGAILGGADEATVEKLRRYSLNIGLAFQVRQVAAGACRHAGRQCVPRGAGRGPHLALIWVQLPAPGAKVCRSSWWERYGGRLCCVCVWEGLRACVHL